MEIPLELKPNENQRWPVAVARVAVFTLVFPSSELLRRNWIRISSGPLREQSNGPSSFYEAIWGLVQSMCESFRTLPI